MQNRFPSELVDPQASAIHRPMIANEIVRCLSSIFSPDDSRDSAGSHFSRTQSVINSFAGEWFDDAGGIANEEQIFVRD